MPPPLPETLFTNFYLMCSVLPFSSMLLLQWLRRQNAYMKVVVSSVCVSKDPECQYNHHLSRVAISSAPKTKQRTNIVVRIELQLKLVLL